MNTTTAPPTDVMPRSLSPPRPAKPETAREARARRAVEGLLAAATLVTLAGLATQRGPPDVDAPPWRSVAVDVARDGPGRLRLLPGLGPTRVAAILKDREARGPPVRLEDLDRVRGIGPKTIESLRAAGAIVGSGAPPANAQPREGSPGLGGAR